MHAVLRAQQENRAFSGVVWCWVGLVGGWVVPREVGSSARRVRLDRRRSRQRTATIGVFGFATVQSVRNALAEQPSVFGSNFMNMM